MPRKEIEFLPIIYLLILNKISYEFSHKCFKLTLHIPSLNIHIDKYYISSTYYIYEQEKFIKKLKADEFIKQIEIMCENTKFDISALMNKN